MKDFQALRSLLAVLAVLSLGLLVYGALVAADRADLLIPSPESAAEQFVSAMAAHRYSGALNQLSQDLLEQVKEEDLRDLMESIEASSSAGIQDAHEEEAQEQGETAQASVRVKLGNNQEQTLDFPLQKENGLWALTSIDPLRSLAK
jgi:hypothetical protein